MSWSSVDCSKEDKTSSMLPWVEKYRPQSLDDVISHSAIIQTINRFIKNQHLPHMLFHGPPGTGKTSVAQAVARSLYGKNLRYMTLELNASDDRGIQVVRETIKRFAETRPSVVEADQQEKSLAIDTEHTGSPNYVKLIILDEADQMTGAAQMALRRIIEVYTAHVRFLLICNIVNKISPALQSRCTKFRFPSLKPEEIKFRTRQICDMENVNLTEKGMDCLLRLGQGDFRRILNTLQSSFMGNDTQTLDDHQILDTVGRPSAQDLLDLLPCLMKESFVECFRLLTFFLKDKGYSLMDIISEVYEEMLNYTLPISTTCVYYQRLAEIQYRLARGADEFVQGSDLIGLFISIREDLCKKILNDD